MLASIASWLCKNKTDDTTQTSRAHPTAKIEPPTRPVVSISSWGFDIFRAVHNVCACALECGGVRECVGMFSFCKASCYLTSVDVPPS